MAADNSKTTIMNFALAHLKQRTIASPTEASEQARKCVLFYNSARRSVLRYADWNFASVKLRLAQLGNVDDAVANPTVQSKQDYYQGFSYLYAEPANVIRVRRVFNEQKTNEFDPYLDRTFDARLQTVAQVQNHFKLCRSPITDVRAIACNIDEAWGEFTKDVTDESQFDDMFVEAFALELAMKVCIPLTADKELFGIIKTMRDEFKGEAARKNGGEGTERLPSSSSYEDARSM